MQITKLVDRIVAVPHTKIKARLDAEKRVKKRMHMVSGSGTNPPIRPDRYR